MRRPLFFAAAAFAAAILISSCFSRALALGVCAALAVYAWRIHCKGWSGADVSHRRALILLVSFTISLANLAICDHRLAADPLLDVLEKPVTLIGIVKEASAGTNSKGKPQMKLIVDVRVIDDCPVRSACILVTVPISGAGASENIGGSSLTLYDVPPCSVIRFNGTPKQPEGKRNPNCFDYSFYLKAGERMLCFRTVSYALSLQKEIDEFLTAAVKVSSSNSGCGKETRSGNEEQLRLKASPAGLVITHLNGTYNCGIKVAELQAEVILKGNDLRVLPFVEPAMKCLCPVDEAEITLDGLMKNREYVLYYKDFKPIQFRYTDTLDLTLDLAGYYPD